MKHRLPRPSYPARWCSLLLLVAALIANPAQAAPPSTTELSDATNPSIASDGESVVFIAAAEGGRSAHHLDLSNGTITNLMQVPDARRAGVTAFAVLSGDGCVVVAVTEIAFDLFRDDDLARRWDVYRLILPHCGGRANDWRLVSADEQGTARDDVLPERPAVNDDGTIVAYSAPATTIDAEVNAVTVVDVSLPIGEIGRSRVVPGLPTTPPTKPYHYAGAAEPTLSGDGTTLSFSADFDVTRSEWMTGRAEGGPATSQVFSWNRRDDSTQLVSHTDGHAFANGAAQPDLSGDGSTIAFVAAQPDTSGCPARCATQIFRSSTAPGSSPELVSVQPWGDAKTPGDRNSFAPTINRDGTVIAFLSDATNLSIAQAGGGAADDGQLLVASPDRLAPAVLPVGDDEPGTVAPVPAVQNHPDLSATGTVIMFDQLASVTLPDPNVIAAVSARGRTLGVARLATRLDVAELDFGSVAPGQTSAELFTSVRNIGPGSFRPIEAVADSDAFTITGGTCVAGTTIAQGESCTIRMVYRAETGGAQAATLQVRGEGGATAQGTLRASVGVPRLRIDPAGADLGTATIGEAGDSVALKVTNLALDPTAVGAPQLGGNHPADFSINSDCNGKTLAPQQSCTVNVQFKATDEGLRSGTVVVTSSVGDRAAAVVGGFGSRVESISVADETYAPGGDVAISGVGFAPGSSVWASIIGERSLVGPFVVNDDGTVTATIALPANLDDDEVQVAVRADDQRVFTQSVSVQVPDRTSPTFLPGFGLG